MAMVAASLGLGASRVVKKLKTGVVGAGVFGAFHAGKHLASARADLVGIHDLDQGRARAVADRFGCRAFAAFSDLVECVDALVIASPAPTHYRLAREALEAGLHVYVEKPLAMNLREADQLIGLAEKKAVVLQVGHQERFVLEALGAPRADALPRRLEFSRCAPPCGRGEDVSVVYDLMIHDLDIARLFGCGRPQRISACGDAHETVATLIFEGGREASFIASRRANQRRRQLTATYDDGAIEIDFMARSVVRNGTRATVESAFADPLGASVEAFFSSILDGAPTIVDGRAGRSALEWAILIEDARLELNAGVAGDAKRLIA